MPHAPAISRSHLPLQSLLLGSVCISFSPIFIKLAAIGPDSAGFYRMLFAGLSLLIVLKVRHETLRMPSRSWLLLGAAGTFLAIDFMCWHRSIELIGPGFSTLLGNFQVFFTALFSRLIFRQSLSRPFILAACLALCGLLMITGPDWSQLESGYRYGIIFGLLTALFYSGYILLLKEAMNGEQMRGIPAMLVVTLPSSLLLAVTAGLNGQGFNIPSSESLLALLGVGVISTTLGWTLISSAIKQVQATLAGLVLLLQPTLALIWDVLFFARPVTGRDILGVLLILSAIYIGTATSRSR